MEAVVYRNGITFVANLINQHTSDQSYFFYEYVLRIVNKSIFTQRYWLPTIPRGSLSHIKAHNLKIKAI